MGDEVDFLTADKHQSFLQFDSINLSVRRQVCQKNSKQQQVHNILVISQGKHQG